MMSIVNGFFQAKIFTHKFIILNSKFSQIKETSYFFLIFMHIVEKWIPSFMEVMTLQKKINCTLLFVQNLTNSSIMEIHHFLMIHQNPLQPESQFKNNLISWIHWRFKYRFMDGLIKWKRQSIISNQQIWKILVYH